MCFSEISSISNGARILGCPEALYIMKKYANSEINNFVVEIFGINLNYLFVDEIYWIILLFRIIPFNKFINLKLLCSLLKYMIRPKTSVSTTTAKLCVNDLFWCNENRLPCSVKITMQKIRTFLILVFYLSFLWVPNIYPNLSRRWHIFHPWLVKPKI